MAKITDIMFLQQPEQHALRIKSQGDMATFSRLIGEGIQKIDTYLKDLGELPADIPFVEYPAYEQMTEKNIGMVIGFYTANELPAITGIESVTIPSRKVVVCLHKGSYEELAKLYNEMVEWIKEKGYEPTGTSIEHYYTKPEVPQTEHITRIVMPLK